MKLSNKQNAPKNSKSSAQQSEVINTSPYAYFEHKWHITDDDSVAHLDLTKVRDDVSIQVLSQLLKESAEESIESYWDTSRHKRYRHHDTYFIDGLDVGDKTCWFYSPEGCDSDLELEICDNKSGRVIGNKTIDLHSHTDYYFCAVVVDYDSLAIDIWETIKNVNGN